MIIEGTAGKLLDKPVVGMSADRLANQRLELAVIEVLRLPLPVAVNHHRCRVETLFLNAPADRRVRPERQHLPFLMPGGRRQHGSNDSARA